MAVNIFKKAKAYVKAHPRTSFQDAIQKVKGGKSVSGVKRKKAVTGTKRKAVTGTKRKRVTGVKVASSVGRVGATDPIKKGKAIVGKIDSLTQQRAKEKNKEMKLLLAYAINAEHDKLDKLKRAYKKL
jgi:hypothetical protein